MNNREQMSVRRGIVSVLSLLMVVVCTVVTIIASRAGRQEQGFGLGDYSGADASAAEQTYGESGDPADLINLLKILLYQSEVEDNKEAVEPIRLYGTKLLDLAKSEEINLEEMDKTDGTLLELLKLIREYGAK